MPNFENPQDNNEVHSVKIEENEDGKYCTVEIANYYFKFVAGNDGDVHDVALGKLDGRSFDLEEIRNTPFFERAEEIAHNELFGPAEQEPPKRFEVTPSMLQDAKRYEFFHEHGEEETERVEREQNRPASGPYKSTDKAEEKKEPKEDETDKQGEFKFDKDE